MFDLISYNYTESVRKPKSFRTTDGMHGHITFDGTQVGFELGLEKLFALMMGILMDVHSGAPCRGLKCGNSNLLHRPRMDNLLKAHI